MSTEQKVEYLTTEKVKEYSKDPKKVMMEVTHDVIFEPWPAERVLHCVEKVAAGKEDSETKEFSSKYILLYKKALQFKDDPHNMQTLQQMIFFRKMVEEGALTEEQAGSEAAKMVATRFKERVG